MSFEETSMPPQGCDGNAAPYVLGALPDEEFLAFRKHMESCAVCRDEVSALQIAADALPAVATQLSAPVDLKRRVMADVELEASLRASTSLPVESPARARSTERRSWLSSFGFPQAMGLGAMVAVIAVLAIVLIPGGSSSPSTRVIKAQVTAPSASVSLQVSDGHAELNMANMPQTEPNRVYEVWVKRSGNPQPTDALFTVTAKGDATVGVPGSLAGVKEVLVTSEPLGGSKVPTRTPIIVANLS